MLLNSSINKELGADFIKQFDKLRNNILEIYRYFVKGDILRASTKMNNILFRRKYYGKVFYEYFMKSSQHETLFRCRQANKEEVNSIIENLHDQMFHIAFNNRNIIGNNRFSISGFPCLYLGSSIECCKKEINFDDNKELVTCDYHLREDFMLYDLTLNRNVFNINELKIFLLKYLIILAVSYTINPAFEQRLKEHNGNTIPKLFLTYYVIPQLITASIASRGEKKKETQCIRYHSVRFKEDPTQYNYVFIPRIKKYNSKSYYDDELFNKFEVQLHENKLVNV